MSRHDPAEVTFVVTMFVPAVDRDAPKTHAAGMIPHMIRELDMLGDELFDGAEVLNIDVKEVHYE